MRQYFDSDERFDKVVTSVYSRIDDSGDCHIWTGAVKANGYGQVSITTSTNITQNFYAHRLVYELQGNNIPDGMEIHHKCFNRQCVNPDHLQVVTHAENQKMLNPEGRQLKSKCFKGHEYTEENTLWTAGRRMCRECKRNRERSYRNSAARRVDSSTS